MASKRDYIYSYEMLNITRSVSCDSQWNMFTIWIIILVTSAYSQDTETTIASPNVTTLYPINKTIIKNNNDTMPWKKQNTQTWKLEATFIESNLTDVAINNNIKEERDDEELRDNKETRDIDENGKTEDIKDFKPSQQLGSFFDEDNAEIIETPIAGPVIKKPASAFVSSIRDEYFPKGNQIPREIFKTHKEFPYKFEDDPFKKTKFSWHGESIESKPTVEAPTKVPAGGLYKSPDAFKEKPNNDEDFELNIDDGGKEMAVKKRVNPWRDVVRLVTAFIPVGLIISALTPSVISIHSVENKRGSGGIMRRSDHTTKSLAPISEQCRRRLLCEIHSDRYYMNSNSKSRVGAKHCYKIHCEDTEALWSMLRWMFTYNQQEDDQRGRFTT